MTYPVIWMDIELPGGPSDYTPAPDNGWNSVYTAPCSSVVKSGFVAASVDRADFNGFADYVTSHSSDKVGVYSAPDIWASIFGTGSDASMPNTYEWTYESFTSSLAHPATELVPDRQRVVDLRELLRRRHQRQQVRADVAVVGRRRKQQRRRRLRPDRRQPDTIAAVQAAAV